MTNNIECPNCGNVFDVENVLAADIEKKLQLQYQDKLKEYKLLLKLIAGGLKPNSRTFNRLTQRGWEYSMFNY